MTHGTKSSSRNQVIVVNTPGTRLQIAENPLNPKNSLNLKPHVLYGCGFCGREEPLAKIEATEAHETKVILNLKSRQRLAFS